ncbi:MAG: hypothetical protein QXY32_07335 [Nitrososphaerota archaeon]
MPETKLYSRVREIINDKIHGSTTIAVNLLTFLSDELMYVDLNKAIRIIDEVQRIVEERSSMVLPSNLIYVLKKTIELSSSIEEKTDIVKISKLLLSSYVEDTTKAVENSVEVLKDCKRIFTLSYSSQITRILERTPAVEVCITTGWPLLDGYRAFREFRSKGLGAKIYPDSSIYEAISSSEAVILGCDAVLMDGSSVNRSGSKAVALICHDLSIPLYIVCDSMKLDFRSFWNPETWLYTFEEEEMRFQVFEKIESGYVSSYISNLGFHTPRVFLDEALRKIENYPYELLHQQTH